MWESRSPPLQGFPIVSMGNPFFLPAPLSSSAEVTFLFFSCLRRSLRDPKILPRGPFLLPPLRRSFGVLLFTHRFFGQRRPAAGSLLEDTKILSREPFLLPPLRRSFEGTAVHPSFFWVASSCRRVSFRGAPFSAPKSRGGVPGLCSGTFLACSPPLRCAGATSVPRAFYLSFSLFSASSSNQCFDRADDEAFLFQGLSSGFMLEERPLLFPPLLFPLFPLSNRSLQSVYCFYYAP